MAIKQVQLVAPTQLAAAVTPYITVPANTSYRIGRAAFANPTGGAQPITVYLVPLSGAPTVANEIIAALNVPAGSTYVSPELAGLVMPAGSTLQAFAGAAASIVFYASGVSIQ